MTTRLEEFYKQEVVPKLMEKFGYTNPMQVPRLEKITLNMGVKEQIIFPEIDFDQVDALRGMDIAITTSARTNEEAKALLEAFRFPFRN